MQNKKYIMAITLVSCLLVAVFTLGYKTAETNIYIESDIGLASGIDNPAESHPESDVHCRIRIYKDSSLIMDEYHAGVVTDLGDNTTLAKLFGDADYNMTQYNMNATYISIGNQSSIDSTVTVLPDEWNRTIGTVEDEGASTLNVTATFYPDSNGPYIADCIGLNLEGGIGVDSSLWAYDTFSEVTGIDETFTINIEFSITVSHS